jgi:hypothetical protein
METFSHDHITSSNPQPLVYLAGALHQLRCGKKHLILTVGDNCSMKRFLFELAIPGVRADGTVPSHLLPCAPVKF